MGLRDTARSEAVARQGNGAPGYLGSPHDYDAARGAVEERYPARVVEAGGPDHYAAAQAQALAEAIQAGDWVTVRTIADDPHTAGDDVDTARGALAGANQAVPGPVVAAAEQAALAESIRRAEQTAPLTGRAAVQAAVAKATVRSAARAQETPADGYITAGTLRLRPEQYQVLLREINPNRVRSKQGQSHLEAWDVRRTLIRIFGFGGFKIETMDLQQIHEKIVPNGDRFKHTLVYLAQVRLTIYNDDGTVGAVFEDAATGDGANMPTYQAAADFAVKGLALTTPIPTPSGWTTMGALRLGDEVIDRAGQPCRVRALSEIKRIDCYRVTLRNGEEIICDDEHRWVARVGGEKTDRVYPVAELAAALAAGRAVVFPLAEPAALPRADLPLDPWVLGYWLGNGSTDKAAVTCHADDADDVCAGIRTAGYEVGTVRRDPRSQAVTVGIKGIKKILADMGLLGHKHVPAAYLRASIEQRRALLAGLMDSDGTVSSGTRVSFVNTDPELREAVVELARSLGEHVYRRDFQATGYGKTVDAFSAQWTPWVVPFALPRKAAKTRVRVKRGWHAVRSIERVETVPTRCISVDSPTRTYLAGDSWVPTHNTALSQALKRCAVNLGDQFGLSLYNKGQTGAVVVRTLTGPAATGGVEEVVRSEVVHGETDGSSLPTAAELRDEALSRRTSKARRSAIYQMVHPTKGTHPELGAEEVINENGDEEGLGALVYRIIQERKGDPE